MKKIFLSFLMVILTFMLFAQCDNAGFTLNHSNFGLVAGSGNTSGSYTETTCSSPMTVTASAVGGAPSNYFYVETNNSLYVSQDGAGTSVTTITYTFSLPVTITNMRISDIDRSSTYNDKVTVTVNNGANVTASVTFSDRVEILGGNGTPSVQVHAASNSSANTNGGANFSTDAPITELKVEYADENPTSGQRFIYIEAGGTICCPPPCVAGTNAPSMTDVSNFVASSGTYTIPCGSTTANLATLVSSNLPNGTSLTVHSGTPATNANKISSTSALGTGTYYVAFYDSTNDCYSPTTQISVIQETDCCNAGDVAPTVE